MGLLLLIACTNVANMLLARATVRQQEISVRAALGASRGRIIRQLLVESALLAVGGMVAGTLFAYAGIGALARFMPRQGVPWETQLRLDQPVLFFALGTAALATLIFGLFPALQGARRELMTASNSGGRSGTATRGQNRMRNVLVVAEVTLSVVLLLGARVLMRTFLALVNADLGFDPKHLLVIRVALPPGDAWKSGDVQFYTRALDRLRSVPEVVSVAVSNGVHPFGGMRSPIEVLGRAVNQQDWTLVHFSSEAYLDTIGVRLIAGRQISRADVVPRPPHGLSLGSSVARDRDRRGSGCWPCHQSAARHPALEYDAARSRDGRERSGAGPGDRRPRMLRSRGARHARGTDRRAQAGMNSVARKKPARTSTRRRPKQRTPADVFETVRTVGLALPDVEATVKYDESPVLKVGGRFLAGLASAKYQTRRP